jgi:predicted nucleic acid-binding protein
MILVDTSVVIDLSRGKDAKLLAILPTLPTAVCGITRAEVLRGARSTTHRLDFHTLLAPFRILTIPDLLWDQIGDNLAALRRSGIAVPFQDITIATTGIYHGVEVWTRDKQFRLMQTVLTQLKLFQEPP